MSESILEINNLSKRFGAVKAVTNLSFSIEKGNIYGILGPNGSGKSTTLGIVLNVVNKTEGEFVWFNGKYSHHEALKRVGAIIERPNFYPFMSAEKNLRLVCDIKEVTYSRIDETLELVGLLSRKASNFSTFSLGMKQRLAIASALLSNPEVLILDEPTNGLDPQGIHQIREIITKIASLGTTILLASHLLDEVEKVCTHVLIIRKGKKIYAGSVNDMSNKLGYFELNSKDKDLLMFHLKQSGNFSEIKLENDYVKAILQNETSSAELNKFLIGNDVVLSHLVHKNESLESKFLQLTSESK